ncbi:YtzI protein [Heyndrickxia sp. MSNUG]|uniref:YtzI protein n=1 Tax=Heyndrickxia sp. MSNUG TaxID=3136677 RepID=UPI003C2FAC55
MYTVLIIAVIIVIIVLVLSVVTTSKAYQFKHTVDPVDLANQDSSNPEASKVPADETEGQKK